MIFITPSHFGGVCGINFFFRGTGTATPAAISVGRLSLLPASHHLSYRIPQRSFRNIVTIDRLTEHARQLLAFPCCAV